MRSLVSITMLTLASTSVFVACGSKGSGDAASSASASAEQKSHGKPRERRERKSDDEKDRAKAKDKVASSADPTASASASSAVPPPASQPTDLPAGRSPVPDPKEWASAKEITVKGSTALGCETKIIREWFRVSCHGKNDQGGTPTAVKITKGGGHPDQFIFVTADISSLVFAYTEGTDLEAMFGWTDKSHKLVVQWPKGSPEPNIKGTFEGASSPLDRAAAAPGDDICACDYKLNGTTFCEPYTWGKDALACESKYKPDCTKMLKCASGDATLKP